MENAITIKNLKKEYKLYSSPLLRIFDAVFKTKHYKKFTALDGLTLDIPKGEVVGILGKNGSGKSTLLKIITGVTKPTSGEVMHEGRIAAMLELTSGFDLELTGIENIYLKAISMGIKKEDIESKIDDIIEFADIGKHIYEPVRTYSSGMKSRLGFAVSVNIDPDILVVDEVLSVGDDIFRLKCIEKMKEFRQKGKTILFVSHSLFTVKSFCNLGMWIKDGKLMEYGDLGPVILKYENYLKEEKKKVVKENKAKHLDIPVDKSDYITYKDFKMYNNSGEETDTFSAGEDINISFTYNIKRAIESLNFSFTIRNSAQDVIFMSSKRAQDRFIDGSVGSHTLQYKIKNLNLIDGTYHLSGELLDNDSQFYRGYANKVPFTILQEDYKGTGTVYFDVEYKND
ncbi:MAG: ABC transporter ATP-binding protein [Acutalibacteraceae bacterium]|nr:ABC transporter ATP-binding protein [Acutalibacteraceae bacterium]